MFVANTADVEWLIDTVLADLPTDPLRSGLLIQGDLDEAIIDAAGIKRVSDDDISSARRTVVVFSEALREGQALEPVDAALSYGLQNGKYNLVPLLKEEVSLPARFAMLAPLDLSVAGARLDRNVKRLLTTLPTDAPDRS